MTLKPAEYMEALNMARRCAMQLAQYPLNEATVQARQALEFGPFLDPTAWSAKHEALEIDLRFLEAAATLSMYGKRLLDKLNEEQSGGSRETDVAKK